MEVHPIFIGFITVLFLCWFIVKKKFNYWSDREILAIKPKFPLGNISDVGTKENFIIVLQNIYNRFYKRDVVCGMYSLISPILIVMDLDVIKDILIRNFNNFHDRGVYYNEEKDPLSAHLFAIAGHKWKNLRNKLSPTFTSGKIKMMFGTITDKAQSLKNAVDSEASSAIDIKNLAIRFTADVIGSCAFGLECNALNDRNSEIISLSKKIFNVSGLRTIYVLLLSSFPNFGRKLGLAVLPKDVSSYFMNVVRETMNHREQNNIKRNDFFNLLLEMKNEGKVYEDDMTHDVGKVTFNEMAAQAFVFFFAGFETSSTVISFALYELAENKDIQEKVRSEILRILEKHNGQLTYEAVNEMEYVTQVVNETLRKYPPVGLLVRVSDNEYKVPNSNHVIEKGTQVFIPVYAIHNNPDIYPQPETFNPDRFTPDNIKTRHHLAFLPFGNGSRNCIGNRFGMLQTIVGIVTIIQHFNISVNNKTIRPIKMDPKSNNMNPVGGLWLNFHPLH